jgi:hypothetical protein
MPGQGAGVAAAAPVDRDGAVPVFLVAACAWPFLCWWFSANLRGRIAR